MVCCATPSSPLLSHLFLLTVGSLYRISLYLMFIFAFFGKHVHMRSFQMYSRIQLNEYQDWIYPTEGLNSLAHSKPSLQVALWSLVLKLASYLPKMYAKPLQTPPTAQLALIKACEHANWHLIVILLAMSCCECFCIICEVFQPKEQNGIVHSLDGYLET